MPNTIRLSRATGNTSRGLQLYPTAAGINEYIPAISVVMGIQEQLTPTIKDIFYSLNFSTSNYYTSRMVTSFTTKGILSMSHVNLRSVALGDKYYGGNGALFYHDKETLLTIPLILMCLKAKYLQKYIQDRLNPTNNEYYVLVVNRDLGNLPIHSKINKLLNKNFFPVIQNDVDFVYVNDIIKSCYNQSLIEKPVYSTIQEMITQNSKINNLLVPYRERDPLPQEETPSVLNPNTITINPSSSLNWSNVGSITTAGSSAVTVSNIVTLPEMRSVTYTASWNDLNTAMVTEAVEDLQRAGIITSNEQEQLRNHDWARASAGLTEDELNAVVASQRIEDTEDPIEELPF